MLAWFAWLWFSPGSPPYRYQLAEEGPASKFPQLGLEAWPDLILARYEVYTEGVDQPLATGHVARRGQSAPVLLDWENRTSELLTSLDSKLPELAALSAAIAKHAPQDALILAWWDTSRQINLLSARDTLFKSHVGEPLIAPAMWRERTDAIRAYENKFWGAVPGDDERRKFQRFADALLAEPQQGAAILRELAGTREAYIAIHVTDLYKLGLMRPSQFDITYKNFPMEGNMHGLIGYLKQWMQDNTFITYTLQSLNDKMVRGYFLRDPKSSQTLVAQMLPFTQSQPLDLQALQLIYQQGGYWVYKIPGGKDAQADAPVQSTPQSAPPSTPREPAPAAPAGG
ncbi:hydroxylamine oxidation protein HaoB [Nitrosovibrio tenuis]|uniref:Hydroxylamine oxidation protein HaoB n=1 Tax=Nitrosovibrio tenuis TaxID=1233 RepID=A0A1H7S0M3_9PROT|nr:hydroxylamine oxidation protein HaoB [Nitrosovibrio tenuis]